MLSSPRIKDLWFYLFSAHFQSNSSFSFILCLYHTTLRSLLSNCSASVIIYVLGQVVFLFAVISIRLTLFVLFSMQSFSFTFKSLFSFPFPLPCCLPPQFTPRRSLPNVSNRMPCLAERPRASRPAHRGRPGTQVGAGRPYASANEHKISVRYRYKLSRNTASVLNI